MQTLTKAENKCVFPRAVTCVYHVVEQARVALCCYVCIYCC